MFDIDALVVGLFTAVVTGIYLFMGLRLAYRPVAPALRLPSSQFALFWLSLAAISSITAGLSLEATFASPSDALVVKMVHLEILLVCAALWGLLGFLTYLFTGKNYLVPWSIFYAAFYVVLSFLITASRPSIVVITNGVVSVQYTVAFAGPLLDALLVGLLAPVFAGAFLYFSLVLRTTDRTVRFRITLTSWSLIAWLGLAFLDPGQALGSGLLGAILSQSLGAIAALVILLAYYPPRWVCTRFGVHGIDANTPAPVPNPLPR